MSDTDIIIIIAARLSGTSWPRIVQMMGWQEKTSAQKLRRTVRDKLFPKATKKKKHVFQEDLKF